MEIFTFNQTCNKTCVVIARYSASVEFAVDLLVYLQTLSWSIL